MKYSQSGFFQHLHCFIAGRLAAASPAADGKSAGLPVQEWSWRRWFACGQAGTAVTMTLALSAFPAVASEFTLTNAALPGMAYSSVACGDYNNDGKTDVLLTGQGGSSIPTCQVWQNQAGGPFTNLNVGLPGLSSSAVARGDFDNDGKSDLLLTGFAWVDANNFPVYLSQVWHNLGNGTFTNIQAGLPGVDTGAVALGDFDNDGNLDILLTGYSSTGGVAQVWRNLGDGTFTNMHVGLPGVFYSAVALADYDNDGKLDILLMGMGTADSLGNAAIAQLWRNLGNGSFTNIPTALPGVTQGAVAWGDFDQDGRPDILLTGYTQAGAASQVWRNLGNGSFANMNVGLTNVYQSAVALADYDNDGKLDIVLAGLDSQSHPLSQVWRNTGNWVFTNLNAGCAGIHRGSVAWADFDNDGRLDLLLAGLDAIGNPILQVHHNNTASGSTLAPQIHGLKPLANNRGQQLSCGGQSGFSYTVWASTNLIHWTALGIPNEGSPGTFQFSDRSAVGLRSRFYRLSRP